MHRFHPCILLLAAGLSAAGQAGLAVAEDFRVDNATYASGQNVPSSQSSTIFRDGIVYDILKDPDETVVFDKSKTPPRFVLLKPSQRMRAELTTDEITTVVGRMQPLAAMNENPVVRFLAEPKFQEQFNESAGELTLSSPLLSYRLLLAREPNRNVVQQYHEFCDWCARLDALLSPRVGPPFGRLVVNAAIAKRQAIASEVFLTVATGKAADQQRVTIRSQHHVTSPLNAADLERVEQSRKAMGNLKLVSFDEYRKASLQ